MWWKGLQSLSISQCWHKLVGHHSQLDKFSPWIVLHYWLSSAHWYCLGDSVQRASCIVWNSQRSGKAATSSPLQLQKCVQYLSQEIIKECRAWFKSDQVSVRMHSSKLGNIPVLVCFKSHCCTSNGRVRVCYRCLQSMHIHVDEHHCVPMYHSSVWMEGASTLIEAEGQWG